MTEWVSSFAELVLILLKFIRKKFYKPFIKNGLDSQKM